MAFKGNGDVTLYFALCQSNFHPVLSVSKHFFQNYVIANKFVNYIQKQHLLTVNLMRQLSFSLELTF